MRNDAARFHRADRLLFLLAVLRFGGVSPLFWSISGDPVCVRWFRYICCRLLDDFGLPSASAEAGSLPRCRSAVAMINRR
jgi:hypothetical protein